MKITTNSLITLAVVIPSRHCNVKIQTSPLLLARLGIEGTTQNHEQKAHNLVECTKQQPQW